MMPAEGVFFRSWAWMAAVPRKNAKGDSIIRLNRTGNKRSTLPWFDFSISESGSRSVRFRTTVAWADRGHFDRKDRPSDCRAARWLTGFLAFVFAMSLGSGRKLKKSNGENTSCVLTYSSSSFVLVLVLEMINRRSRGKTTTREEGDFMVTHSSSLPSLARYTKEEEGYAFGLSI